jgi:DNA-binding transcriptional LysR family regulator
VVLFRYVTGIGFAGTGVRQVSSMDLHHIRYFLAVCETLNFTRAAEQCNVTQPALSRAIQQLEQEIGGLLFRRERNLTHLTDLGALLRPRLQEVVNDLSEAKSEAARFLTLEESPLTVGVMCTIGPTRFTGLMASYRVTHPGVQVRLVEGVPAHLSERLESGDLDVAIMAHSDGFPERFNVEPLYSEQFVLAFPAGHRFETFNAVPLSAVEGEPYLRRVNCEYRDHLAGLCSQAGFSVSLSYESEREDWIQTMVAGGMGICFMPEFSAVVPGIQIRPVVDPEVRRDVCLVSVAGRRFSPAVSSFVTAVKGYGWPAAMARQTRSAA